MNKIPTLLAGAGISAAFFANAAAAPGVPVYGDPNEEFKKRGIPGIVITNCRDLESQVRAWFSTKPPTASDGVLFHLPGGGKTYSCYITKYPDRPVEIEELAR
jgi:hypothetical protein